MLRIFTPVKIQRLQPGLNPQTWVPEASMLITRPPKLSNHSVTCLSLSVILSQSEYHLPVRKDKHRGYQQKSKIHVLQYALLITENCGPG